jgi:UDP-N-acetylmuramoyl-L-alanyl-D-glutamate--2,6-diaminopimelate ligase
MPLSMLFADLARGRQGEDVVLSGLSLDSRRTRQGDCFFALGSPRHAAGAFIPEAMRRGAVAIALEHGESMPEGSFPAVWVDALRAHLGLIAARFYGQPSHALCVTAITGTNGKTTVAHLCTQASAHLGKSAAYIGTLGIGPLDALEPSGMTTPDALTLQAALAGMRARGVEAVALEASSHALAQDRLAGTRIHTAVFTGLGHDHLDYHPDLAHYKASKARLFRQPELTWAVINADDPAGATMRETLAPAVRCLHFSRAGRRPSLRPGDRFLALREAQYRADGSTLTIDTGDECVPVESRLVGDFNAENLLATLGVMITQGHALDAIRESLQAVQPVRGRLETFAVPGLPRVIVDFAHSPDSLERVLTVVRSFTPRRLVCVFGCGGERDATKRPLMGAVAGRLADAVVITDDNARGEDPAAIAREILAGIPDSAEVCVIHDRAEAIEFALSHATAEDIVLVAGKGHEATQEIAGVSRAFSDQAVISAWLEARR